MKYLGIDYGAKRVGVAVSDNAGKIAFPRGTIENDATLSEAIGSLIANETIEAIVIGDTRAINGESNDVTSNAETFARALKNDTGLPVQMVFEGWSSIEASRYAPQRSGHDDSAAAAIILQRYLDIQTGTVD
jgi:putative Holliday junction resolvase